MITNPNWSRSSQSHTAVMCPSVCPGLIHVSCSHITIVGSRKVRKLLIRPNIMWHKIIFLQQKPIQFSKPTSSCQIKQVLGSSLSLEQDNTNSFNWSSTWSQSRLITNEYCFLALEPWGWRMTSSESDSLVFLALVNHFFHMSEFFLKFSKYIQANVYTITQSTYKAFVSKYVTENLLFCNIFVLAGDRCDPPWQSSLSLCQLQPWLVNKEVEPKTGLQPNAGSFCQNIFTLDRGVLELEAPQDHTYVNILEQNILRGEIFDVWLGWCL